MEPIGQEFFDKLESDTKASGLDNKYFIGAVQALAADLVTAQFFYTNNPKRVLHGDASSWENLSMKDRLDLADAIRTRVSSIDDALERGSK